ncbi:MAG: IPT/TIG domain-containing protein, partial [Chloroflexi bacterium]|nr:IPT/TIG domain-containing protein [Chloroflexota bacterium]
MKNKILSILCVLVLLCSMCLVAAVPAFAAPGAVTYTPATGPVGQVIAVTGTGWSASETILAVTVGGKTATHTLVVSAGGALSGNITAPAGLSWGAKNVVITGSVSGEITSAGAFTVTPSAYFTPITGATSTIITVTGAGWTASDPITSVTFSTPLTAATYSLTVDGNCNLSGTITVPVGLTAGLQNIVITGTGTGAVTSTGAYTAVAPTAVPSPKTGPVGTVVTITGSGWALSETINSSTGVTVGGVAAAHTLVVSATGALTGTVTVPTGAVGVCNIVITGSVTGLKTFTGTNAFTVASKTASFAPTAGPIGQVITVTGLGWTAGEVVNAVTVGGATATNNLTVSTGAALSGTITVPSGLIGGLKDIVITGAVSGAVTFTNAFNLVTATATFSPSSGPSGAVGQTVNLTGSGWIATETFTSISVGGINTLSAMPAAITAGGAIPSSYSFVVPAGLTAGLKNIIITGSLSGPVTFTNAFTVTTSASFAPTSGNVGSTIVVTGAGWKASETINATTGVTVGGIAATSAMTVAANGSIAAGTITVPAGLTGGLKDIVITGSLSGAVTFSSAYTVNATAGFAPIAGPVGTIITTTGSGWRSGESILSVTVGGISATNTLVSSSTGVLTGNIIAPAGLTAGLKDIVITGASTGGVTFTNAFTGMTNTAVFAPTSGPITQSITVTGAGWSGAEAITGVTIGGVAVVAPGLTVLATVLSGTITVPAGLTGGIKNIVITGATSGAVTFTSAYTVTPRAVFGTTSGPVATVITMGAATDGWKASETINNTNGVTVGGVAAVNTLSVNGTGVLSGTITVPSGLTGGSKDIVITASGTGAKTYAGAFTVTASQTFTPIAGPIGTSITATGAGWGASESIIVTTVGGLVATNTLSV